MTLSSNSLAPKLCFHQLVLPAISSPRQSPYHPIVLLPDHLSAWAMSQQLNSIEILDIRSLMEISYALVEKCHDKLFFIITFNTFDFT